MAAPANVIVEADGGSRGNPGLAGFGALLRDAATGDVIAEAYDSIGRATNNVAEYRGLIAGLELFNEHAPEAYLEVRMDSKLVIEQMAGRWKIKHPDIRPLAVAAQRLAPFGTVWTWVPRERNKDADRLANLAMDRASGSPVIEPTQAAGSRVGADVLRTPDGIAIETRRGDAVDEAVADATPSRRHTSSPLLGWTRQDGAETTLVLLRHGVTRLTKDKRFSGPGGDDPPLLPEGRDQVLRAADALGSGPRIDAVVASPMRRTKETAEIVASALGLEITVIDGFREAAFGAWDGLTLDEVEARWPAELARWMDSFSVSPPGGESMTAVQKRVEAAVDEVRTRYAGKRILVVSHVNPIKLAVRACVQMPLEAVNHLLLAPASITVLSYFESGATALRQFSAVP